MIWQWGCVIVIILLAMMALLRRAFARRQPNSPADCGEKEFVDNGCDHCPVKEHCRKSQ